LESQQWTPNDPQQTVEGPQWTIKNQLSPINNRQSTINERQAAIDTGRLLTVYCRLLACVSWSAFHWGQTAALGRVRRALFITALIKSLRRPAGP